MFLGVPIVHGVILALGLILPLGIQNIFIFNQGANHSRFIKAMPSVITAGLCDTVMILLAVFGVSVLILEIIWLKLVFLGVGFFFLMSMGYVSWKSGSQKIPSDKRIFSSKRQILFALTVSLLNPHAVIDSALVIGLGALQYEGSLRIAYTLSCILVSWAWFLSLSYAGHQLQKLTNAQIWLSRMNKVGACCMWGVGLYLGLQLIHALR
jgi:L-lysine exporter family protein LysE/ArgO